MLNKLSLVLFLIFLFFMPLDISRLFGEKFSMIQTLIKSSLTLSIIFIYLLNLKNEHTIKNYSMYPFNYRFFLLPWFYLFVATLSILWSSDVPTTIKSLLGLVSVLLVADLLTKKYALDYILLKSLLILDIIVILSLISFILKLPFAKMEFVDAVRYAGITYGAHAIGRVAFIAFLIRIYFLSKNNPNLKTIFVNLIMLGLYLYSIQIADSRQIQLALIAISPLWLFSLNKYIFKEYRAQIYLISFFIILLAILLMLNFNVGNGLDTLQRTGKEDIYTFTGRIYVWESAFKLIDIKPFIGYGYGAGGTELYSFHKLTSAWSTYSAHNIFIHQLLDLGIVGLLILFFMLMYFLYLSIKLKNKLMISFFIFIAVVGFLERSLSGPPSLMYLFFILFFFYLKQNKFNNKVL